MLEYIICNNETIKTVRPKADPDSEFSRFVASVKWNKLSLAGFRENFSEAIALIRKDNTLAKMVIANPSSDFTRNRALCFRNVVMMLIFSKERTLEKVLSEYFDDGKSKPGRSALCQSKKKLKSNLPVMLFYLFADHLQGKKRLFKGKFRLLLCDGSDINISRQPAGMPCNIKNRGEKEYSQVHMTVLYDYLNQIFLDLRVQGAKKKNEIGSLTDMIEDLSPRPGERYLIMGDRLFGCLPVIASCLAKNSTTSFIVRAKDVTSQGLPQSIWSHIGKPKGSFDREVKLLVCRKDGGYLDKNGRYRVSVGADRIVKGLGASIDSELELNLRMVRVKITDSTYEVLFTDIDKFTLSKKELKKAYAMRWTVEVSIREAKKYDGLDFLSTKDCSLSIAEIYMKLFLHNLTRFTAGLSKEAAAKAKVLAAKYSKEHKSMVIVFSYSAILTAFRKFMLFPARSSPSDYEYEIKRNVTGRKTSYSTSARNIKAKSFVSFAYR